jgi:hypothetical protein
VLIGGADADDLASTGGPGGTGQAILVGGGTIYDSDLAALDAILNEWASGSTYLNRINHILNGSGGVNGTYRLDHTTVLDDLVVNVLANSAATDSGLSWFLVRSSDTLTKRPNDRRTELP